MRAKYGHERRMWVMDRGMVSEANLDMLREAGASWLVGTPKSMLKNFERQLLDESDWSKIETGVEVKLCAAPEGSQETFVLCRSPLRAEKEKAMRSRQVEKLEKELSKMQASARAAKRALRGLGRVERRVGRLMERYPAAARLFEVTISEEPDPVDKNQKRLSIHVVHKAELEGLGLARRRRLPAAHQPYGPKRRRTVAHLHRPHTNRGLVPHRQARPRPAPRVPPKAKPRAGPHPRLLPVARPVAHAPAMDEGKRPR